MDRLLVVELPFLIIMLGPIALALWYLGKRFITIPRTGIIEPGQKMGNRLKNLTVSLLALGVIALAGVLLGVMGGGAPLANYALGIIGLVCSAGICLAAYLLDANRLYVYAALLFVAFAGGEALAEIVTSFDAFALAVILAGALILLSGLVVLVRFLRKYRLPEKDA